MNEQTGLIRLLLARMERVSADSTWAHQASGVRGALLRRLADLEDGRPVPRSDLKRLLDMGFEMLNRAAQELSK